MRHPSWMFGAVLVLLVACGEKAAIPTGRSAMAAEKLGTSAGVAVRAKASSQPADAKAAESSNQVKLPNTTMIIRTGQVTIDVDSLGPALTKARDLIAGSGGYLANSAIENGEGQRHRATLEIRLPAARYDEVLQSLKAVGTIRSSTTTSQDVGEEYVDVEARMNNGRRLEARLIDLLASRTGKLTDVLEVEHELARVREEIERYDGRLRYLKAQAAMSTIAVTIEEPAPLVNEPGNNIIVEAAKQSWRNLVRTVASGIELAGAIIPMVVLLGLAWVGFRAVRRRNAAVSS